MIEYVPVNSSNTKLLVIFAISWIRLDSSYNALQSPSPSVSPSLRFLVPTSILHSSSMHLHHPRLTNSNQLQACQTNLPQRNLMKRRSGTNPGHMKHNKPSTLRQNSKRCSKRIKFSTKETLLPRARETGWQGNEASIHPTIWSRGRFDVGNCYGPVF